MLLLSQEKLIVANKNHLDTAKKRIGPGVICTEILTATTEKDVKVY